MFWKMLHKQPCISCYIQNIITQQPKFGRCWCGPAPFANLKLDEKVNERYIP